MDNNWTIDLSLSICWSGYSHWVAFIFFQTSHGQNIYESTLVQKLMVTFLSLRATYKYTLLFKKLMDFYGLMLNGENCLLLVAYQCIISQFKICQDNISLKTNSRINWHSINPLQLKHHHTECSLMITNKVNNDKLLDTSFFT